MAVELATAYISILPDTSRIAPGVSQALGAASNGAAAAGTQAGSRFAEGMKKAAVAGGVLIGAALTKAISGAMELGSINASFEASLGATKEQAKEYGKATGDIYKAGFGGSMADVSKAVEQVQTSLSKSFDDPKKDLQDFSKYALNFNQAFGVETAASIQTVSQLITNGLASNGEEAFDLLTTSFQRIPAAMRDELPEILDEYGTNFRALGFNGETSFNLLIKAAEQGKFALDKTGDALKEFTIRGSDMSKSSVDAYTAIGLNAEDMSNKIAQGGPAAQEALQATANGLLGISDPAERANTAIALFGTPLEDLSVDQIPQFLTALTGGGNGMDGFAGASERMSSALGDSAAAKLETLKRSLQGGLTTALISTTEWMDKNRGVTIALAAALGTFVVAIGIAKAAAAAHAIAMGISAAATGAGTVALAGNTLAMGAYAAASAVIKAATTAWAAVQWVLNAALSANPIGLVVVAIAALVAAVVWIATKTTWFQTIWEYVWNAIKTAASFVWESILKPLFSAMGTAFEAVGNAFSWVWNSLIKPMWDALSSVISGYWNNVVQPVFRAIMSVFSSVGDTFSDTWNNIIKPAWTALSDGISWYWENVIQVAFNALKAALGLVGDYFKWVWESVIKPAWEALGNGINWVWKNVISPAWDGMKAGLDLLKTGFQSSVSAIGTIWDTLKGIIGKPINAVIRIFNDGILPVWNGFAGLIGKDDWKIEKFKEVGWAKGGYTGPGGKYEPAGIVHRDEFVVRKEARSKFERNNPGALDHLNRTGALPGYADGGIVESMRRIVAAKFPSLQLTSGLRFTDSGYHSKGQAADFSNGSSSTPEMQGLAAFIADNYAPQTVELIHDPFNANIGAGQNVGDGYGFYGAGTMAEHRNHVHWAVSEALGEPSGGLGSVIGNVVGAIGRTISKAAQFLNPLNAVNFNGVADGAGQFGELISGLGSKALTGIKDFIKSKLPGGGGGSSAPGTPGGGAEQWRSLAMQALEHTGFTPASQYIENMLKQIQSESGGNPGIVQQVQDVNSGGNEGVGLLQIIPGTFATYRDPSLPNDRTDPFANMVAALNYVRARYGDPNSVWGKGHGYDSGGMFQSGTFGWNTSGKPEAVLTNEQWQMFDAFIKQLQEGKIVEAIQALTVKAPAEVSVAAVTVETTENGSTTTEESSSSVAPESTASSFSAEDFQTRALDAGSSFLEANFNQLVGDLGGRTSGGAIQELVKQVQEYTIAEISNQMKRSRSNSTSFINRR